MSFPRLQTGDTNPLASTPVSGAPFLPRLLAKPLQQALAAFPAVVLTGARQTGKTTLVQRLGGGQTYLTLDDLDVREQALSAPDDILRRGEHLTLDEVQRSPDLLLAVTWTCSKSPTSSSGSSPTR